MSKDNLFVYFCLLIANLYFITNHFNPSGFLFVMGFIWTLVALLGIVMEALYFHRRMKSVIGLRKAENKLEMIKYNHIISLLEDILKVMLFGKKGVKKK